MNTTSVLTHLIRAGRDALHLEKTLTEIGYAETPYFNLYGEITDAIHGILDEDTDTIEESKAYAAIHDPFTPDEICAEELAMFVDVPSVSDATMEVITDTERRGNEGNVILCCDEIKNDPHQSGVGLALGISTVRHSTEAYTPDSVRNSPCLCLHNGPCCHVRDDRNGPYRRDRSNYVRCGTFRLRPIRGLPAWHSRFLP